ncbi:GNAT family N-acetyltransferase [Brevibacterium sp. FME37]|uniref:GNAT family N-acetyltransferase n=1 Tax=Brevibacterium sp. FME37 TaxID=2742607 RepID=UPI001865C11C|nr:GNAT family N-acetyltransferase [Brevibacterium sp. FME37]
MTQSRWSAVRDNQVSDDVDRLLLSVPEWFGRPESNAEYVDDARTMETWTVRSDVGEVVGVGTAMMRAVAADVRARGAQLLQVKTLGASSPDPNYDLTRHFYEKMGFLPLEETDL